MARSTWNSATIGADTGERRCRTLAAVLVLAALVGVGLASVPSARAETLECDGLHRLSDNFLLDLQIRFSLDSRTHRYRRYENTGRGWQLIAGENRFSAGTRDRILLEHNLYVTSYLEPLTGAYYYIDRSGKTLSLWGHCGVVGGPPEAFF